MTDINALEKDLASVLHEHGLCMDETGWKRNHAKDALTMTLKASAPLSEQTEMFNEQAARRIAGDPL